MADHRHLVEGLNLADSIAFDLHKWMYLPFEVGCILVNRPDEQKKTFETHAKYFSSGQRGVCPGPLLFADLGIELTRGFKALKVWMSLKAHGSDLFGKLIGQNIEQTRYFVELIKQSRYLKLMAPVKLNVVCFRFESPDSPNEELNKLNEEILFRIQESGAAIPSGTRLGDTFTLRIANVNHRSRRGDFEFLRAEIEKLGIQIIREWRKR